MVPRISSSGTSFKGLAMYLTHDPKALTSERVAWTHTHNLADDHVPSAVNEMYLTVENAEFLKRQAGIRAGGRSTENAVKHISLNWSPEDKPTREHVVATAENYLKKMGWHEHQAVFIAHKDKPYSHVHIMLNVVHPETGLRLNDNFDFSRSQTWAAEYEREQGRIYCKQRELPVDQREKNPPRNIWEELEKNERRFLKSEIVFDKAQINGPKNLKNSEWEILRDHHKAERIQHFADGKIEFRELRSTIYREFREEFRDKWAEHYRALRSADDLKSVLETKKKLVEDQKAELKARCEKPFATLKKKRDERYRTLLDRQKEERAELSWRQKAGVDAAPYLSGLLEERQASRAKEFRRAATEVGRPYHAPRYETSRDADIAKDTTVTKPRSDRSRRGRLGVPSAVRVLDALFTALVGEGPRPPEPTHDPFQIAAEEATKRQQSVEYRSFDHERLARQKAIEGD
jgi:hypothetical protein